jgi:ferrous iron transport protein B
MMNPWTGIPLLLLVLYFGLYKFVGGFGAGTVVDFLESTIFDAHLIPWVNSVVDTHVPWVSVRELLAHDYGVITLGLRYAIAIVLPLVGTFFFAFAIIEDTGYLPRLAMLIDRVFKKIGLSGRAVIPMTLGFGCDTMATLVSRILETRRERIIATLLLALAIPCSAQLGVIMALVAGRPAAVLIWAGVITLVFIFVGWLAAQILPDERPVFYMEVPPLRAPRLTNVMIKTYTRMRLYFVEILPLFILASVLIWIGQMTGLFAALVRTTEPAVRAIGLPGEAAVAFLFGFFRRDYGAAGLYDLHTAGLFDGVQLLVAATTLTLFVPCIAQFIVALRERGARIAFAMFFFVLLFAFGVGYMLNAALRLLGVTL